MSIQCSGARCPVRWRLHLGGQAPGVGRDDVAALLDVACGARRARRRALWTSAHVPHSASSRAALGVGAAGGRARWRCRRRGSRSARPSAAPRRGGTPAPRSRPAARPDPSCSTLMSAIVDPPRARVASQGVGMPLPEGEGNDRGPPQGPLLIQASGPGRHRHPSWPQGQAQVAARSPRPGWPTFILRRMFLTWNLTVPSETIERAGDLGVGLALDQVLEDVDLARGQQVVQRRARGGRARRPPRRRRAGGRGRGRSRRRRARRCGRRPSWRCAAAPGARRAGAGAGRRARRPR